MEYRQKSARLPRSAEEKERWKRCIVVLEQCPLQSIQTDKGYQLLSDRHKNYHAKHKLDPADWRPDVVHQCLLHLQDSPLNRAGMLQVFLRTRKGVCIAVDPRLRVPRHMRLFEKMMVSCFFKMKVRASGGYLSLMRVVRNPITDHIPGNTVLYRVEKDGESVRPFTFCATLGRSDSDSSEGGGGEGQGSSSSSSAAGTEAFAQQQRKAKEKEQFRPFAFIIGGMARGDLNTSEYEAHSTVKSISLGKRGMSAAAAISVLLHGLEEQWLREDNEAAAGLGV